MHKKAIPSGLDRPKETPDDVQFMVKSSENMEKTAILELRIPFASYV